MKKQAMWGLEAATCPSSHTWTTTRLLIIHVYVAWLISVSYKHWLKIIFTRNVTRKKWAPWLDHVTLWSRLTKITTDNTTRPDVRKQFIFLCLWHSKNIYLLQKKGTWHFEKFQKLIFEKMLINTTRPD